MENKILYLGLTENKNITDVKNNLQRFKLSEGYNRTNIFVTNTIIYLDEKHTQQLRKETWEQVETNAFRITNIHPIKNNLQEGESISLLWE